MANIDSIKVGSTTYDIVDKNAATLDDFADVMEIIGDRLPLAGSNRNNETGYMTSGSEII